MKNTPLSMILSFGLTGMQGALAEPLRVEAAFDPDAVSWIRGPGDASVSGQAFIRLKDGSLKGCAGFGVELLPVADYSSERIRRTYANTDQGQILIEDHPPTFIPDVREYHEMVLKANCDASNEFVFSKVPAGQYYVLAFIIWDVGTGKNVAKAGGAVMKRIDVQPHSGNVVQLRASNRK